MWKIVLSVLGFIVFIAVAHIVGNVGKEVVKAHLSSSQPTQQQIDAKIYEAFKKAAEQLNRRGPVMVDQETRWDRSVAGPGARLTFFYSFPKYSARDIDRSWLLETLQPDIKKSVCGNQEMKSSLQHGGTYVYVYSGNDGIEIARFEVNRYACS